MVALGMHVHDVVAALGILRAADPVTALPRSIDAWVLVAIICAAMLVAMVAMLIYGWQGGQSGRANNSVVRSWIAVSLIAGLLILTAAALGGTNQGLQNILVGGVIAATGSAIAFYFATKSAENANAAVLKAAGAEGKKDGAPTNPLLLSKTVEPAQLGTSAKGTVVTYSFKVTNNGTVPLTGVHILDTLAPPAPKSYKWPGADGVLRPGEAVTATAQRTITHAEATEGAVTSIATASGMPPTGPAVNSEPETTTVLV